MASIRKCILPIFWLLLILMETEVNGHGRLMNPPSRNSMWRFGYENPVNYNDNELFCGGSAVQWFENEGRCGVCGDAYNLNEPRPHERGGEFARGTIVRHYSVGQDIDVEVELTANHQGRFEMYLCPNNNPNSEATQECFDRYPLYIAGTRDVRFVIPDGTERKGIFRYKVTLPPHVTCSPCVVQWNYYTANMWGTCPNGTESVECGRPEMFRNCADVNIITSSGGRPPISPKPTSPYVMFNRDYRTTNYGYPVVIRTQVCVPTYVYRDVPGMYEWCQSNCIRATPFCPSSVCQCHDVCEAIGDIGGQRGADVYCHEKCIRYPSQCPPHRCRCY